MHVGTQAQHFQLQLRNKLWHDARVVLAQLKGATASGKHAPFRLLLFTLLLDALLVALELLTHGALLLLD